MSLIHKHPAIWYKIEIFEWRNNDWMELLRKLNIKMNSLNKNRNIENDWILLYIGRHTRGTFIYVWLYVAKYNELILFN